MDDGRSSVIEGRAHPALAIIGIDHPAALCRKMGYCVERGEEMRLTKICDDDAQLTVVRPSAVVVIC